MGFVTSFSFRYKNDSSSPPSVLKSRYIWLYSVTIQCVCDFIYIYINIYIYNIKYTHIHTNTEVKLLCIFASFYLSNCDVIGFRPKVCYCNTFTEKKKKSKNVALSAVVVKDFMLVLML